LGEVLAEFDGFVDKANGLKSKKKIVASNPALAHMKKAGINKILLADSLKAFVRSVKFVNWIYISVQGGRLHFDLWYYC
jgi:hypothetical protein